MARLHAQPGVRFLPATRGLPCSNCCGRWYAEDCSRLPSLATFEEFGRLFATAIVGVHALMLYSQRSGYILSQPRLPGILSRPPIVARIKSWTAKTKRAFDPLEDAEQCTSKTIYCPKCRSPIITSMCPELV